MSTQLPVIFLPGTLCDERLWMPVWQHLDIADRRYVPLQWAETLEQMAGLTEYAVAGDKVHLVGFSMGGFLACQYALAQPENIASLTLIGYSSFGLTPEEIQQREIIIRALEKGQFKPMNKQRLALFVQAEGPNGDNACQTVREMEQDLGGPVLKYQLKATSNRPDLTAKLAVAGFDINLIAAQQDRIAPLGQLTRMHKQIKNSTLQIIDNSGHMLPLEAPEQLATQLSQIIS
ncbi:alpha/beta fold hydrolase [Neptunicella sp. SCSIO 80796]|uniref:alpha/beta fold hydrolase n=1 Tax=Neptunicella plasticusilytica TaxID=3117012 RepID=UPI003A4E4E97